jgi:hypothetical protein
MKRTDLAPRRPRHRRDRTAVSVQFLAVAALFALPGCGQREIPVVEAGPLTFESTAHHPASGPLPAQDVAIWRQPTGAHESRFYAAVGSEGIMVHLADGAFLQRLAQSATSHLGVLHAMPVDEVVADFLVAVDPSQDQLTWFEINAGSGALRRLAGQPAKVGDRVAALCTQSDASAKRHRILVVTHSGALQDWTAVAQSGKQPNFANRIVATLERTIPLGGAGGDCAVDQATGAVFVLVDGREVRRVDADWTLSTTPVIRSGETHSLDGTVTSIELIRGAGDAPQLLLVDQDGRRLVASDQSGRVLASIALEPKVATLRTAGDAVAVVTDSAELQVAPWSRIAARLGLPGTDAPGGQ